MWLVTLVLIFSFLLQREVEKWSRVGRDQERFSFSDQRDGDMFAGPLESSSREGGTDELQKEATALKECCPVGERGGSPCSSHCMMWPVAYFPG